MGFLFLGLPFCRDGWERPDRCWLDDTQNSFGVKFFVSNGLKLLWDGDENVLKLFDNDVHGAIWISKEIPKWDLKETFFFCFIGYIYKILFVVFIFFIKGLVWFSNIFAFWV